MGRGADFIGVLEATQAQYWKCKQSVIAVKGLEDTMMAQDLEEAGGDLETETSESIVSLGPYHEPPIVDRTFSSDSSYIYSKRYDVAYSYDTLTSS